jgi:hypothetical protein
LKKPILLLIAIFSLLFCVSAQASTWNRLEKNPVVTSKGKVYTENTAPYFIVGYSDFSNYSYSFEVTLDGAKWNLPSQGCFETGVYYSKRASDTIVVSLDYGTTSDKFNARWKNVYIPVACEILRSGEIYISVNGLNSPVSSTKTLFAKSIDGKFTPSVSKVVNINDEGILGDIIINDTSTYPYPAGTLIKLSLNNDFEFVKAPTLTGTRKYENNLRFFIDADDNSTAYIEILNDTALNTGRITASGTGIRRKNVNYAYKSVSVTLSTPSVSSYNGLDSKTLSIAKYSENAVSDLSTSKDENESPKSSPKNPLLYIQGLL